MTTSQQRPNPIRYVALGSSFAAGPGIDPIIDAGCGRSGANYPNLLADRLGLELIDVTCSGATLVNIVGEPQLLLTGGRVRPQLDAVPADADLVTVTIGGNDVEFIPTLLRYSFQQAPQRAPREARAVLDVPVDRAATSAALAVLPAAVERAIGVVRDRAPGARVVLVDYLTVVAPSGPSPALPISGEPLEYCRQLAQRLASATASAARLAGADLVRASELSRDHGVGSPQPWVSGWEFGNFAAGGTIPYHPNAEGMRAVAGALVELLR